MEKCRWHYLERRGIWLTECQRAIEILPDAVLEERFRWCPYCRSKIISKAVEPETRCEVSRKIEEGRSYEYENGGPARLFCTDRPTHYTDVTPLPVVTMNANGTIHYHDEYGKSPVGPEWDLVEIER